MLLLPTEKLVLPSLETGDVWARMQYTEPVGTVAAAAAVSRVMLALRMLGGGDLNVVVVLVVENAGVGIGLLVMVEVAVVEETAPGGTVWHRAGTVVGDTGSSSLISSTGSSKNRGDGGGASVCRRLRSGVAARRLTTEGTTLVEMLRLTSELRRCFLKGFSLASCSLPEILPDIEMLEFFRGFAGALSRLSKYCLVGEGVNAGPGSGTGTRAKASCELISRTIAS